MNEFGGHGEAEFMPRAGTNSLRAAGVQCVLMFNMSVYWPTRHFGQDFSLGKVQDPSGFLASGSEPFKKVPGSQQNARLPGGSTRLFCRFQLELHHTPCAIFEASNMLSMVVTLDMSHVERSELKAKA